VDCRKRGQGKHINRQQDLFDHTPKNPERLQAQQSNLNTFVISIKATRKITPGFAAGLEPSPLAAVEI